uniref:Zinc finger and BTB domain containing 12, tandem duplicate 2 n=1 Tax=Kryptolebias marmoratus TaxID=37003 RepID=A0A3Q2ZHB6_KRYMA
LESGKMSLVCFRLPGHGDTTLKHMNSLRSRQHFCDITIVASNNQTFKGHKVVLAACSPFLRDQFLLNPSPRLQVSMLYSSSVVCDLLQSCYTGFLQFNPEEIVNYLTAASYFQMEHIVERCRGALEKYVHASIHSDSPPPTGPSPVHQHSPAVLSVEENSETSAQGSIQHHDDGSVLDEACVRVPEKRPLSIAHRQDLWYLAAGGLGGGLGLDFSQEELKAAGSYLSAEIPRLEFSLSNSHGDKVSPIAANGLSHFSLEESDAGEGSSGLTVGTNEAGDESVAVVGSTSSVTGPVICEHCGLTFPSAHSLAVHSRSTHLMYGCPCCGKHFHHATNLTRHMAVHRGGSKAHQCPLCYKTFTQKSTLIDHMNLHSGERPHHCAYCHARFAHKPALRRHLKEQHGKTTGQNSLHEQEERERARGAAGTVREEDQECLVTEQVS